MTPAELARRLAAIEARRRGPTPDLRRLAECEARLIARVDATDGLEAILAFRAEIEAARRSAKP